MLRVYIEGIDNMEGNGLFVVFQTSKRYKDEKGYIYKYSYIYSFFQSDLSINILAIIAQM